LNSAEQKCLENINHKIAYDYVFSIEIEEAPNGANDDDTTELKKITVVISDETVSHSFVLLCRRLRYY
jgi:hypothetical protein